MKRKSGLAHLCHHDIHWEFCFDYEERVEFINLHKPIEEQPSRLKWFKLVPDDKIPGNDSPAWEAYHTARKAYDTAREDYVTAWEAYDTAWEAYLTAWKAYVTAFSKELDQLHAKLFPGCPWDGKTMFPEK